MPVYWLGRSSDAESFAQVAAMIAPQQSSPVNGLLLRMLGLHQSSERDALLQGYLLDPAWKEYWPAVLEALAIHQSADMQTQLLDIARNANADVTLRRIAISALSRSASAQVFNVLNELAGSLNPQDIRLEALESLATYNADFYRSAVPGRAHTDIFNDIVWTDTNPRVRALAIECLATFRDSTSNALLLKIAREHTDRHTRTQAMEELQRNVL